MLTIVWGWPEILNVALIGFLLVVVILLLLVEIMKLFGMIFTYKRNKTPITEQELRVEEIAAITTALALYTHELHDHETEVLTIQQIKRIYSPWNSKIHGLTQIPNKK